VVNGLVPAGPWTCETDGARQVAGKTSPHLATSGADARGSEAAGLYVLYLPCQSMPSDHLDGEMGLLNPHDEWGTTALLTKDARNEANPRMSFCPKA
jgi:hypothetical protein